MPVVAAIHVTVALAGLLHAGRFRWMSTWMRLLNDQCHGKERPYTSERCSLRLTLNEADSMLSATTTRSRRSENLLEQTQNPFGMCPLLERKAAKAKLDSMREPHGESAWWTTGEALAHVVELDNAARRSSKQRPWFPLINVGHR